GCRRRGAESPGRWASWDGRSSSWLVHREALVGVEDPRLDEVAIIGLAPERLHGAGERVPVDHPLLPGFLDLGEGPRPPRLVVTPPERLVEPAIRLDVGIELMVLV